MACARGAASSAAARSGGMSAVAGPAYAASHRPSTFARSTSARPAGCIPPPPPRAPARPPLPLALRPPHRGEPGGLHPARRYERLGKTDVALRPTTGAATRREPLPERCRIAGELLPVYPPEAQGGLERLVVGQ